jgi:intracellular sulfur oxidation DsrE/DsrF family protein
MRDLFRLYRLSMFKGAVIAGVCLAVILGVSIPGQSETKVAQSTAEWSKGKPHRVIIQVTQNDPAVMNMALNNAENLVKFYQDKGEKIEIEFVAYGAGLNMVRDDTSPVKDRLAALGKMKNITISGCGNTLANQSRMENKEISLIPEAHVVATGIARVVELEEQGWTYVRP